jgi:DNA-binding transcriptional ArsR family regulator
MSTNSHAARGTAAAACLQAIDGNFFRALSEPARVDLLRTLIVKGRSDVGTIAEDAPRDRSVTTRHLQVLEAAGILRSEREGRHTYYEIDGERVLTQLEQLVALFRAVVPTCCPPSVDGSRAS